MLNQITLPWPHKALSPNGGHGNKFAVARQRKAARQTAWAKTMEAIGTAYKAPSQSHVTVRWYPKTRARRDDDNLIASFKSYRDGIADAMRVDDTTFKITHEIMEPDKEKYPHGAAVVTF